MKNETNVSFAAHLRRLMRRYGLNDVQLARATGLSHTAIANYKRGRLPKLEALRSLATHFDVALDELLHGSGAGAALQAAARAADQPSSTRVAEREGQFEAAAGELLEWESRARVAEEKLLLVETALADLLTQLRGGGRSRGRSDTAGSKRAKG